MKKLITIILIAILAIGCKKKKDKWSATIYGLETHIAVPDNLRDIGYDSIQLIAFDGKIEANFCYYNNLRFKKDTIYTGDTSYRKWWGVLELAPGLLLAGSESVSIQFSNGYFDYNKGYFDSLVVNGYKIKIEKIQ